MPRYVIYGAGAIGGIVGAMLHASGADVRLVARGAHGRAIAANGLRVDSPSGSAIFAVPVVDHPAQAEIGAGDVVILAMKSQDSALALDQLAGSCAPDTAVVCAQNGVDNERAALRLFAHVHGCLVVLPATYLEPGVVTCSSGPIVGVLDVGRYPVGRDEVDGRLAKDLRAAGFLSEANDDVMTLKRCKLLANLANAVDALFGEQDGTDELSRRARAEGTAVLEAAGFDVSEPDALERRVAPFRAQAVTEQLRSRSSSWQSLARSTGSTEVDFLNGEIVLLARLHGVPTPINSALQQLAREHAQRLGAPGEHDPRTLFQLLDAAEVDMRRIP